MAGVLKEMWEAELQRKFRNEATDFMNPIPSRDNYVNNDVINLTAIGDDPNVLINNTSYPIAVNSRTDTPDTLALNKYDTENTSIKDDELYALPYDKEGSVIRQHRETLEEKILEHSLYLLAPDDDTTNMPIVQTTGADNGASRKSITIADIILAKKKMDDLKMPKMNRILVLCSDHIQELLLADEATNTNVFTTNYHRIQDGKIVNMYGFQVYENIYNPRYDASFDKVAFGAASAGTDRNASVFFYAGVAYKAQGSVTMYHREAAIDPENRQTVVGFNKYHICGKKQQIGFGAIAAANV